METYRHASYRYSTGQGFNVNVDVPKAADDVASFKMEPLMHNLGRPAFTVSVNREADRLSMQVEESFRQMKNLGYDSAAGKKYRTLKGRLEVIRHLMTNYPIEYVKAGDLEKLYKLYERSAPGGDAIIQKIIAQNKDAKGVQKYVTTAKKVRKGYPLYDQFGRKLSDAEKKKMSIKKTLSGLGEAGGSKLLPIIGTIIIAIAVIKYFSKPKTAEA
jgi:hypothetical protein